MKIAIVVHGRFHAFDLARELSRNHDITIFTNYPKWAVERFGLKRIQVRSNWAHGLFSRGAWWLEQNVRAPHPEAALHRSFGQWAASQLRKEHWDVVHSFSGVSEEILRILQNTRVMKLVVRGSTHIRTQATLLEEEERRTATRLDRPSRWIIEREEREYVLADKVIVLSSFARDSFLAHGTDASKIGLLPLGTEVDMFRPSRQVVDARCRRILSGDPLRVLYVGSLSFRKGMWDMRALLQNLDTDSFRVRFVGPVSSESAQLIHDLRHTAEFFPKQPQQELPDWYAWGDLFIFPTIEDGFAVVLAQAQASALPILTTTNCCGPDIIRNGETGWVLPIRSPQAFVERLRWCDVHRQELANMVRSLHEDFRPRTWADVAKDFELMCTEMASINGK